MNADFVAPGQQRQGPGELVQVRRKKLVRGAAGVYLTRNLPAAIRRNPRGKGHLDGHLCVIHKSQNARTRGTFTPPPVAGSGFFESVESLLKSNFYRGGRLSLIGICNYGGILQHGSASFDHSTIAASNRFYFAERDCLLNALGPASLRDEQLPAGSRLRQHNG